MRVLFLGLNYAPESIGVARYSTGLCEHLAASGHVVRAVAGQPYYPDWKVAAGYWGWWRRSVEHGVDLTRCPHYVPARPSGARRLIHHVSFALSASGPILASALAFRPDVVMTTAPSLVSAPLAWLAGKLSGAKSWLHVQDFEVEAAIATGLIDGRKSGARAAQAVERRILRSFDRVSSIGPEMCTKLATMEVARERIVEFRNWAEIDAIWPLEGPSPYRDLWGIETPHVALYSGNIANKQGIGIVVEAARLLADRDDLTFVICGQGPNRARLEAEADGLVNIRFFDLQPPDCLNDLLGLATIHLLPQVAGAADLVLPSKLTNMLASGRPVVATAASGTGLAREIEGCGRATPPGDGRAFADAIVSLIDDDVAYRVVAREARLRAETVWNKARILQTVAEQLAEVAGR